MVFSSLIFLWIFLPVVFILYFTAKEQYRNIILLIASLFFYAWGEPVYVFVMMLSIVINYFCGLKIGVEDEHKRKRALFWGVFVNLALLGVFKYTGFLPKTSMPFSDCRLRLNICRCLSAFRFTRFSRFHTWSIYTAGFANRRRTLSKWDCLFRFSRN